MAQQPMSAENADRCRPFVGVGPASAMLRTVLAGLGILLLFNACGNDTAASATIPTVDATEDVDALVGDLSSGDDQVAADVPTVNDGTVADDAVTPADTTKPANCPGDAGCSCTSNDQCTSNFCIDTPAGQQCAQTCTTNCGTGFKCVTVTGSGSDTASICVPQFGKVCDPCTVNQDCVSVGNPNNRCVDQGNNGAFCGSACSQDSDCPNQYQCLDTKDVTGASSKQCVVANGGACACSDSATKLQLATKCYAVSSDGNSKCEGKRTCLPAGAVGAPSGGGLSSCIAPNPATEVCDGVDNNCNGQVDEGTCDDKNVCTDDKCSGAAGCANTPNTLPCSDNSVCTTGDVCSGGTCQPGTKQDCDDKNPCTADSCDLATGCTHTAADGVACDADQNACTVNDICQGGTCVPGGSKPCAIADPCQLGKCNISDGNCTYSFQAGSACNDGNPCTTGEACVVDTCKGDSVKCDDNNACTSDACDIKAGGCVHGPIAGICDDDNACTVKDTCDNGTCLGQPIDVTQTCDDFKPCTTDTCDPKSGCQHKNADGIACDDGNPCTTNDACKAGACTSTGNSCACNVDGDCVGKGDGNLCSGTLFCDTSALPYQCVIKPGTAIKCDASLNGPCQNNACDGSSGKCKITKKPDGLACDADGSLCTANDACNNGDCLAGPVQQCDDSNKCTDDSCDPKLGCQYKPNTKPCDADGNPCTEGDACAAGTCTAGKLKLCSSGDDCIDGKCNLMDGLCKYSFKTNYACNDGSPCTVGDLCVSDGAAGGSCKGSAANCDDKNPCTGDSCDPIQGCTHVNVAGVCSDGNACTDADQCVLGACIGTPVDAKKCDDANVCTSDTCLPASGCAHSPLPGACDDANPCTSGDTCAAGVCQPGTNTCGCAIDADCKDDGNLCNGTFFCDKSKLPYQCAINPATIIKCDASVNGQCQTNDCLPATGACILNKKQDSLGCDADGSLCTGGDACKNGLCVPGPVLTCDDKNPCTDDSCDPAKGCVYKANTAPCDADQNACTQNDLCNSGSCIAGKLKTCDDGEACTSDTCDISNGNCKYAPLVKSCSDNNVCTSGDACGNNPVTGTYTCVAGAAVSCDDTNPCTVDSCDPVKGCTNVVDPTIKVPCYDGAPATKGVGQCKPGNQACGVDGKLGVCAAETLPALELCNNLDDNCDGITDEGCKPTAFAAKMTNGSWVGTGTKYAVHATMGADDVPGAANGSGKVNVDLGWLTYVRKLLGL